MKQTNLNKIKEICKLLFNAVELKTVEKMPFLVQHPFTSNSLVSVSKDTEGIKEYKYAVNNILHSHLSHKHNGMVLCNRSRLEYEENLLKWVDSNGLIDVTIPEGAYVFRNFMFKMINDAKTLTDILMLLNKPWYMTFLKYTEVYLSDKDLGTLLGELWVMQEYPSRDNNASLKEIIEWFKRADKKTLMSAEEYEKYQKIKLGIPWEPNINLEVYRGVSHSGKPEGLSWTTDLDKARWFSERFGDKHSRVYKMIIKDPNHILAYFDRREESEVVIDTTKCKNWEVIE